MTAWRPSFRYLVTRRLVQLAVLGALWGGAKLGWNLMVGDLSAARFLGTVPLGDPFALLQVLATRHVPAATALLGGALTTALYVVVGGRAWCAWVCPVNPLADLVAWLRRRLGAKGGLDVDGTTRRWMALGLVGTSAIVGVPAFESVSPIGALHRELCFGIGAGLLVVPLLLIVDGWVLRRGWCGSLCPLGGFWSLVGRLSLIRVRFDPARCDHCGDCARVCPESHVLRLAEMARSGAVLDGDCTNCMRCVEVCPTRALAPGLRFGSQPPRLEDIEHVAK